MLDKINNAGSRTFSDGAFTVATEVVDNLHFVQPVGGRSTGGNRLARFAEMEQLFTSSENFTNRVAEHANALQRTNVNSISVPHFVSTGNVRSSTLN